MEARCGRLYKVRAAIRDQILCSKSFAAKEKDEETPLSSSFTITAKEESLVFELA
jgi:hypothetical protein